MRWNQKPEPTLPPDRFQGQVHELWPLASPRAIASSITASQDAFLLVSATTNVVVTLPALSQSHGAFIYLGKLDATANTVTVSGAISGENINGSASYTITTQYNISCLVADSTGTRWFIVSAR